MAEESPSTSESIGVNESRGDDGDDKATCGSQPSPLDQVESSSKLQDRRDDAAASASKFGRQGVRPEDVFSHPWASYFANQEFGAHTHLLDPGNFIAAMPPLLYPATFCGVVPVPVPANDQVGQHGGLFAVPYLPYAGPMTFCPPGGLIPLCYNAPLGVAASSQQPGFPISNQGTNNASTERPVVAAAQDVGAQGLRQRHAAAVPVGQAQEDQPQRQVIRRFRVGVQLDLLLILKLAVVVFFFSQDGSKDRLLLLLFLAAMIYTYQTGALTPILRWISTKMQLLVPRYQVVRHDPNNEVQQAGEHGAGNAVAVGGNAGDVAAADGLANERANAEPAEGGAVVAEAPIPAPADQHLGQGQRWWGLLKEIQILIVGFVTSLLPGFQNPE